MAIITAGPTPNTFCWPELCSGDAAASKKFYGAVFGWTAEDMHMPDGDYTMLKLDGTNVGAMYQMKEDRKAAGVRPHWNSYVAVTDARETAKKAVSLGGKVLGEPFEADYMVLANLEDPMGAKFCIHQVKKALDPMRIGENGALCWTELYTTDTKKASAFYGGLFGWNSEPFGGGPMPYTIFRLSTMPMGLGGMLEITKEMGGMPPHWIPYFMVADADATAAKAVQAGGKSHHGPFDIPKVGRIVILGDTEGADFAIIKPNPM